MAPISASNIVKRAIDIAAASLGLILLLPFIAFISIMVVAILGRPVFFCQQRPGLYGNPFKLIKFRTMSNSLDNLGGLQSDAERLTRFGRFLRSTSLDELPELWNVLKGEMSLVGPRPLLMEYLPLYSVEQARRHEIKPGITGWAQVNGRNALSWEEKFKLDVWYVDNRTLLLDIKILMLSIVRVFTREGINAEGEATIFKFTGNQD